MALTGPRTPHDPHLTSLLHEVDRLAAVVAAAEPPSAVVRRLRDDAAVASLRLDGSTIPGPPTEEDLALAGVEPTPEVPPAAPGSWADALRTRHDLAVEDAGTWAREFAGVRAALEADDLVEDLGRDLVATLPRLHERLVRGLVAPGVAGRPRRTAQAVHDRSVGRVLFYAERPDRVVAALHDLGDWLADDGRTQHGLVTAGIVHLELLRIHPFEAANGRTARAAAHLLLRAAGLDPFGLAGPEPVLGRDPVGTYEEVTRSRHRRDPTVWLERWGEAVAAGLRHAARTLDLLSPDVDDEAIAVATDRDTFTIVDHAAARDQDLDTARDELVRLLDAGVVRRQPATRGLRWARTDE